MASLIFVRLYSNQKLRNTESKRKFDNVHCINALKYGTLHKVSIDHYGNEWQ